MSRFSNLEFDDELNRICEEKQIVKDESFFLQEARIGFENGRFEYALYAYSKVLEYNPMNAEAWTGQVKALIELGEFREAKIWADKAIERFPHYSELLAAKAVALARAGDVEGAVAYSDASFQEQGESPYLWLARADVLLAKKEKLADYCIEKALLMARLDWFWHWMASRIYYYYKQFSKALKYVQKAMSFAQDKPVLWFQLGLCQMELGMSRYAMESFERARELDPQNRDIREAILNLQNPGFLKKLSGFIKRFTDA